MLRNIIAGDIDDYLVYSDTDSLKLEKGYNKKIIENYNNFVKNKIKYVSSYLEIPIEKFSPKDIKGNEHTLGLFEFERNI